ncbi:hypothetical protein V475_06435 [Sphingobium baderi LL03]|uniref:Uncharacterized protein n=1 Tax=Sphingobium baderi LL03 TaxID=1114964 RepID=T0I3L3_9SPHN|nr:hypothetical protein L485_00955 [Sphingobium baderi LL03]KMS62730.1 hypothetical protein V475_06435 [Sphingobium baderi LL03]
MLDRPTRQSARGLAKYVQPQRPAGFSIGEKRCVGSIGWYPNTCVAIHLQEKSAKGWGRQQLPHVQIELIVLHPPVSL